MNRRRFLAISAAMLATPAAAETTWQGIALGADARITLYGDRAAAEAALAEVPAILAQVQAAFSLQDPGSELCRLNRTAGLEPSPGFAALMALTDRLHRLTGGAFDPTVQSIWASLAAGGDGVAPVGWSRLGRDPLRLPPGMSMTFNGLAQGWATDLVTAALARQGFGHALVDMGEMRALGGPFRIGVADPVHGVLAERRLTGGAIATSSPLATTVAGRPHLIHPEGKPPLWSTVSVEATTAALADGLSTALVFLTRAEMARVKADCPDLSRITVIDALGDLQTV